MEADPEDTPSPKPTRQERNLDALLLAIERTYGSTRKLIWRSFVGGLFSGIGATLGFALVIGIMGLLIREFGGMPGIGQWLQEIGKTLPTRRYGG